LEILSFANICPILMFSRSVVIFCELFCFGRAQLWSLEPKGSLALA
jgi:hypothetical protein